MGVKLRSPSEFSILEKYDFASTKFREPRPFAPLLPANSASLCRALLRAMREFRPSVVNCWSDLLNLIGGVVTTRMRVPRMCSASVPGLHR